MDGFWFRRSTGVFVALALIFLTPLTNTHAQVADDSNEDVMGYDAIVSSLNRQVDSGEAASLKTKHVRAPSPDPFESVWMHGGAGYVQATQSLDLPNGKTTYLNQKGVQASLGLDLFSPNWMAEGTVRSFNDNEDKVTQVSLKEFELKIFYKDRIMKSLGFRVGGGLSGRYLTLNTEGTGEVQYTTPSSVGTVGLDLFLTERFSIGCEVSGRSAMISDTIDRGSLDGTLRLDAHF